MITELFDKDEKKKLFVGIGPFFSHFGIEFNPFFISIIIRSDGFLRAFGNADAAINAGIGINNQHFFAFMESINRADISARFAFYAGIINYRNHISSPKRMVSTKIKTQFNEIIYKSK